jgi:hypothetical protein
MTVVKIVLQPKYLAVAITTSLLVIAFAAWLPNLHLITRTMTSTTMTLWQKTTLITITTATLAGVQISLLAYYLKQTAQIQRSLGVSTLGITASMLGVGCASCGSVVLTSLIGFGSTTVVLGFLPLRGQEFGLLGIAILLLAIYITVKKINSSPVCKI